MVTVGLLWSLDGHNLCSGLLSHTFGGVFFLLPLFRQQHAQTIPPRCPGSPLSAPAPKPGPIGYSPRLYRGRDWFLSWGSRKGRGFIPKPVAAG